MKMMVVDDSNVIRRRIERCTAAGDFTIVGTAADGVEAIKVFEEQMPDVVTMDLTMPNMDGIECIGNLVQIHPDVLILVVSALADEEIAIEALTVGAHGFLCKPFTEQELSEALTELVAP